MVGVLALMGGCNQNQATGYVPDIVEVVNAADVAAKKDESILPMARGNQWVYDVEISAMVAGSQQQKRAQELTFRCTNVYSQGDKVHATLEAVTGGLVNERQQWTLVKDKGLFQNSVGDPPNPFVPPQAAIRFPIKEGMEYRWEGTGFIPQGTIGKSKVATKVEKLQEVDTGAGRMQAYPITSIINWATGVAVQTSWWAPGYGIVRYRQEVRAIESIMEKGKVVRKEAVAVSVMRLKSTSLKGSK